MTNKVKGDSLRAVTRAPSVLFLLLSLGITLADRHAGTSLPWNASSFKAIPVMQHLPGAHDLGQRARPDPDMRRQHGPEAGQARVPGGRPAGTGPSASGEGSELAGTSPPTEASPHTSSHGGGAGPQPQPQPHSALAVSEAEDSRTRAQAGSPSVNIPNRIAGWQEGTNLQTKELSTTSSRPPSRNDVASSAATEIDNSDYPETLMTEYSGSVRQTGHRKTPMHQTDNGKEITDDKRTDYPDALAEENGLSNTLPHSANPFPPSYSEYPSAEQGNKVLDGQPDKVANELIRNVSQPLYSDRHSDREPDLQTDRETNKVQSVTADNLDIQTKGKEELYIDNNTDLLRSYSNYDDYYSNYQTDSSPTYCDLETCHLDKETIWSLDNSTIEYEELSFLAYKIVCNSSFSLTNLTLGITRSCAGLTTQLIVTQQMEFCAIMEFDLYDYTNLTKLSITNTALNYIEDRSFGNLAKLQILDLRSNQLHVLSWRSLWPHAIPGQDLRSINASGNPLDHSYCENLWLLKWQQKNTEIKEQKEGRGEEGTGEGEREEGEESEEGGEEGGHARGRRQGEEKTRRESEKKHGLEIGERGGKDGEGEMKRRRERREGWTQDTRETSQVLPTEDCPSSGCYLCAASLTIVDITGKGPCRQYDVKCSVSGAPKPHIEWKIPPYLTLLDLKELNSSAATASTVKVALNLTELYRTNSSSPLACVASNDLYVSIEKMNIDIGPPPPPGPVVCLFTYMNTSPAVLYFVTQALAPWNVTWRFFPCAGLYPPTIEMALFYHPVPAGSSTSVGYIKFQDTPPSGHYELSLSNTYGSSEERSFISNRPPTSQACQDSEPVFIRLNEQPLPPPTITPPPPRPSPPPCSALTSTTPSTTAGTFVNPTTPTTSAATTEDSFSTSSPTVAPTHLSISIVLTIVVGVMVVVTGVTWLLLRNLRWPRDRSNMEPDPCPDSPFQINFIRSSLSTSRLMASGN